MSAPLAFEIQDLRLDHDSGFSLSIDQIDVVTGEVLGLLGPTGAGKSTLLRVLAGLADNHRGQVTFAGERRPLGPAPLVHTRRIALVHQRPMLLSRTVQQNVEYGLQLRQRRDEQRVAQVMERCGLTPFARQAAKTLSGGQAQLVALARALVIEPEVLLLDEPTANLDPAHVALVEEIVQEFQRQHGATIVWATHNLFQARRVSHRTALLLAGRLVEIAPCADFFDRPADPRTIAFTQGKMVY
jgi:tungstate transport system ATP-binding protein